MTNRLEIWFTTSRKGAKRAYFFSYPLLRAMPMPLAKAELLIAQGQADLLPANPWKVSA